MYSPWFQATRIAAISSLVLTFILCMIPSAQAQYTETVPYTFTGAADGASPSSSLIFDSKGNLYGAVAYGGDISGTNCPGENPPTGCGVVFELTPPAGGTGPWTQTVLYTFQGGSDGAYPQSSLTFDTKGNLYGTTTNGGDMTGSICSGLGGCGVVFQLTPPHNGTGPWTETPIYTFTGGNDGSVPFANVVFNSGNLYGTAAGGGSGTGGTVFELTPPSGGSGPWTETTLYSFTDGDDGGTPVAGVTFDSNGNIYGTTYDGGTPYLGVGHGVVFELTPPSGSGSWSETPIYTFTGKSDGGNPYAGVIFDSQGVNLYGTTAVGGDWHSSVCKHTDGCGVVFELSPSGSGSWAESVLYAFDDGAGGGYPYAGLIFDSNGNLYGTTAQGGNASSPACTPTDGCGVVFQMSGGAGSWKEFPIYTFTGQSDGGFPYAAPTLNPQGNLFGTTSYGGDLTDSNCVSNGGCGVVYALTQQSGALIGFSPTSLAFGNQTVGTTSVARPVVVTNTGTAALDISSVTVSGNFTLDSDACLGTLAVGKSCKVKVTFTPSEPGPLTGNLTFTDNAPNSPQNVPLSGTGISPVTLTPTSFTFKKTKVGATSTAKKFKLTNDQAVALTGINITLTGDFQEQSTTCGATLPSKQTCTISVTFNPTQTGTRTGQLSVSDSAQGSPQTSALTGTGD